MSRRPKVHYQLSDVKGIEKPSDDEVKIILRAADEIIFTGGRTILSKILKGSKDKKILQHELDLCPSYGYYHNKTIGEITRIVDWMIIVGYLKIEYNGHLPMIVFSPKGWEFYKPVYAKELYERILDTRDKPFTDLIEELKNFTNRQVIEILLRKMGESKNIGFIRFLKEWEEVEVKKVRYLINATIKNIKS